MPKIKIRQVEPTWDELVVELGDPRTPVEFVASDVALTSPTSLPTFTVNHEPFVATWTLADLPWPGVDADAITDVEES